MKQFEHNKVEYARGHLGQVVRNLVDPQVTTLQFVEASDNLQATLLRSVAKREPPFCALIDTGALLTGLQPEAAARRLLELGLESEGVLFIDALGTHRVLQKDGVVVLASMCTLPPERRFTLYDHVHSYGTDVQQPAIGHGALTLAKDSNLRDASQGAYRLRRFGKGQKLTIFLIPELVPRVRGLGEGLAGVCAWLVQAQISQEERTVGLRAVQSATQQAPPPIVHQETKCL